MTCREVGEETGSVAEILRRTRGRHAQGGDASGQGGDGARAMARASWLDARRRVGRSRLAPEGRGATRLAVHRMGNEGPGVDTMVDLFPIQLLFLLVLANRYIVGPLVRRVLGASFDLTVEGWEPTVAFVVPLFNEGRGIVDTIRSLLRQDYPSDKLSVVVVDDC